MDEVHRDAAALARASEMISAAFYWGGPGPQHDPCRYCRARQRSERGRCGVCGAPVAERAQK